jgi:hypothetical protein
MKLAAAMICAALTCMPAFINAQDSLVGTYNGYFVLANGRPLGLWLKIDSVQDRAVSGTAGVFGFGPCAGTYAITGEYKDKQDKLNVRAKSIPGEGVPTDDCRLHFKLTRRGNELAGTTGGGRKVELHK